MADKPVELDQHRGMAAQKSRKFAGVFTKSRPIRPICDAVKENSRTKLQLHRQKPGPRPQKRGGI